MVEDCEMWRFNIKVQINPAGKQKQKNHFFLTYKFNSN